LANIEFDGAFYKARNTNFRPLQVAQSSDAAAKALGNLADVIQAAAVVVSRAVRKVKPNHIYARFEHGFQNTGAITGGAECGDDFGAP
jgi:hypothetical protein